MFKKKVTPTYTYFLIATSLMSSCLSVNAFATVTTTETQKYLVIATGEGIEGNEFSAFDMSNVEIGADQELVSNSTVGSPSQRVGGINGYNGGLDLTSYWVPNDGVNASKSGNRFNDTDPDHGNDTVGSADLMPGARPVYEGIDYSGNVALTGSLSKFTSSNADVNATLGIHCNRDAADCFPNPSDNNSFFADDGDPTDPNHLDYDPDDDVQGDLNALDGVSFNDPTTLLAELAAQRDWIVGLTADTTFSKIFVENTFKDNRNIKDGGGSAHVTDINDLSSIAQAAVITDLDAIDAAGNNDGIAVIDIHMDGAAFLLDNTDWILQTMLDTMVIFRMKDGTHFDFANSSILLGDGTLNSQDSIHELGAIFFIDSDAGGNQLFNVNNAILGGIGLWDFTDFTPDRSTLLSTNAPSFFNPAIDGGTIIHLSNAQGCAQFISNRVEMSNNRWNRCAKGSTIPEPSTTLLFALGLFAIRRMSK